MRQKKALAAMLVCAPCCSGSGQGSSGSGGATFIPCTVLQSIGGSTITMDYEVAGCDPGSDTGVAYTGDPCSGSELFSAGTAQIFTGASTDLGDGGTGGDIEFLWCDGEQTYWVGTASSGAHRGYIEFAFTCYFAADGSRYIAFYALLTLACYTGLVLDGNAQWAYKTGDIAYEAGDPFTLSVTGLSPFASQTSGTCSCASPVISIALHVDTP